MNLQISTQIGQRQSLVMTAQLQQAIHLLQLSNLDLRAYVEKEAEDNPFLEVAPVAMGGGDHLLPRSGARGAQGDGEDITQRLAAHDASLYAHVSAQFDILFANPAERLMAERFLEALEPNGWLGDPLEDIAQDLGIDLTRAEALLRKAHQVDPAGLFARSLAECLALQAQDRGFLCNDFAKLLQHLPMLAAADLAGLCRLIGCDMERLKALLKLLRSLDPKPGAAFSQTEERERAPDLIVTRQATGWRVDLNQATLPAIIVDEAKARDVARARDAGAYVADRLAVARWLHRAIAHRNQTTLAIGAEIVRRQAAFLEQGPKGLVPMTLRDVADAISMHESTVSRVTTGIMMVTPQGTFPLKRLFTTALATDGDSFASSEAVRHRIAQLVRDEDPNDPLSDDALAKIISDEGTYLARRTVAKYRDMLRIPSSFQRRRNAKLAI